MEAVSAFRRAKVHTHIPRPGQPDGEEGELQHRITLPSTADVCNTNNWDQEFLNSDLGGWLMQDQVVVEQWK